MKSSRDQVNKSERYRERTRDRDHKSERNTERNYREKQDKDVKKDNNQHAFREKRYRDDREERHYKSRDERHYDEKNNRTHTTGDRHKREHHHENDKFQKEYKKRNNDDDQHREHLDRYEKRHRERDNVKYDKYNRKDYSTEKSSNNLVQEHSRNREKYNKSDTLPRTSVERSQARSRTPTRHLNSNYDEEKKGPYKWQAEDNDLSQKMRKTEPTVVLPALKPIVVAAATAATLSVPMQAHTSSAIPLPNYYNPSVVNVNKYAEQVQKRKLLWSGKKAEDNASKWGKPQFSEDSDGKVASKFLRLMGIKNSDGSEDAKDNNTPNNTKDPSIQSREEMFSSMEQQYEVARQVTHTMRGVGFGFFNKSS